jgi:transcriptional regulator with XRE-family HTH domain
MDGVMRLLRIARRSAGIPQTRVAWLMRRSQSHVAKVEAKGNPRLCDLANYAGALGLDVEIVLTHRTSPP